MKTHVAPTRPHLGTLKLGKSNKMVDEKNLQTTKRNYVYVTAQCKVKFYKDAETTSYVKVLFVHESTGRPFLLGICVCSGTNICVSNSSMPCASYWWEANRATHEW